MNAKKLICFALLLMLLVCGFTLAIFADDAVAQETDAVAPNATVEILPPHSLEGDSYMAWPSGDDSIDRPLQIVMNFKANDTFEQAQASKFAKYKCDFYLTFTGIEGDSLVADGCYLAGNYGSFGWIVIPTDGLEVENGVEYPVVSSYDANLTYENICDYVKNFTAAIYITPEILDANPNFKVTLALKMTNPNDETDVITVGDPAVYDVVALKAGTAGADMVVDINKSENVGGTADVSKVADLDAAKEELKALNSSLTEDQINSATINIDVSYVNMNYENGVVKGFTYNVSPMYGVGNSTVKISEFSENVTFMLPIPSAVSATLNKAKVTHGEDLVGTYNIISDEKGNYIEVSYHTFSEFQVEIVESEPVEVGTYDELVAALANGGHIKLTADITVDTKLTAVDDTVLDLNTKTLYVNVENSYYNNVTIKNGNIVLGKDDVHVCDGYFIVNDGKTLVLDGVKVSSSAEGIKGYAVFHLLTGANLDLIDSELNIVDNEYSAGYIVYAGEPTATVDVVGTTVTGSKVNGIVHAATVIEESTFTITDAVEHGINRSGVTITDSTVAISGGAGRGITAQHGPLVIEGNSTVTVSDMGEATIELRNDQNLTVEETATVKVDVAVNNTTSGTVTGNVAIDTTLSALVVIGENGYKTLADALNAAKAMTGNVTVNILEKVTLNTSITGNFDSITFVGTTDEAEIYLDVQGYITATGKKVSFDSLKLSKSAGGFMDNAGFMNVAFGIYDVQEVNYTDCVFLNGAYASSGKVTFTECTFYKSHDKYGLWAYGNVDATVDTCTFADYRGIKMYAEGAAKTTDLTVTNTDFSNLTDKPAIVLTYGESVTLAGNTYSDTGVFELDLDGAPNGTPITSTDTITCVNDNGACGVLVDGKIYTTVAQAAAVATAGSNVILLHNSAETVVFPLGVNLNKNSFEATGVTVTPAVAKIGETSYSTLQAAIDAAYTAGGSVTITLLDNVAETLTINEKVGLYLTIDGAEKTLNGKITINPLSDTNDNRRITIKNVDFVDNSVAKVDFITALNTNHYPRLTVQGCTFTGSGDDGDVAIRTKSAYGLVIEDCTGSGLHSFLQNTSGVGITVDNVTVYDSKGGLAMGTAQNVTVSDCDVDTRTYGIRLDAVLNTKVTLDNNVVNSYIPVSVRTATANDYNLTFAGDDSVYTASNTDGVWCAICATEYEEGVELNEATGIVKVEVKTDAIDKAKLWGAADPVAKIGDVVYYTLADAIAAGGEIVLLTDVTEDVTIADGATVILDLGGKTLTGAIKPCKPASLTIKNGTIDNDNASYSAIEVNAGTFVLENVNITSVRHAVRIDGAVTATINGGSYKVDATSGTRHAVNVSGAADVTIVAGTFVGPRGTTMDSGAAVNVQTGATVVINGGDFSGGKNNTLSAAGTLTVYGGTFDQNPIAFVADGCPVLQVGSVYYTNLTEALTAALEGNTLKLHTDITGSITVPADKNMTLDLNGKTLTSGVSTIVVDNAELTVIDSSTNKAGKIVTTDATGDYEAIAVKNNGILTFQSGNVESGRYGIYAYSSGGTIVMNGGTVKAPYMAIAVGNGSLTINGGTLTCDESWIVYDWDAGLITIKGGFFSKEPDANYIPYKYAANMVDLDGTTYYEVSEMTEGVAYIGTTPYYTIQAALDAANADDVIVVMPGTYKTDISVNKKITLMANEATTLAATSTGVTINGKLSVTANGATVKGLTVDSTGTALYINAKDVLIENCTITGDWSGMYQSYTTGKVTFKNCNITGEGAYAIHFDGSAGGEVIIDNCVLSGWTSFASSIKTVTITGTEFAEGTENYVRFYQENVTIEDCTFNENMAVDIAVPNTDLVINNSTLENGSIEDLFAEEDIVDNNITVDSVVLTRAAKIGNVYYETFEEAFAAAENDDTIVLLDDITLNGTVTVPAGKTITLDLAGYTVSGVCNAGQAHMFMVANTATLIIKDSSNPSTGKITYAGNNSTGWIIDVEGAVVLESGTLELTGTWNIGYAVDVRPNAWGTAYTAPTTFTMNGGKILTSDGGVRVASSSYDSYSNISASFVMNGGLIDAAWDGIFVQQSNGAWDVLSVTINGGAVESDLNPIRFYGPAATSYVNGNDCVDIALNGGTLAYTGTEQREWLVEGIIRLGGGVTATEFLEDSSVEASEAFAAANTPSTDYKWVENANGDFELVAKVYVAEVNGTKYESITEALAALQANGGTLELLADASINASVVVLKDTVINGNGKKLTVTGAYGIDVKAGVNLAINNLTVESNLYALNLRGASDNARVTITDSNLTGCIALNVWGKNVVVNATNSEFVSVDNATTENYSAIALNNNGSYSAENTVINITGGSITALDENGSPSIAIRNATATGVANVSNTTVVTGEISEVVSIVTYNGSDAFYSHFTLQDSINRAANDPNATVKLLKDIELSEILVINGAVTIDGNGKTITSTAGRAINIDTTAAVTIENLTIVGSTGCERGINIINQAGTTNLSNVKISGVSHYAVHVATSAGAAQVNIADSELSGYAALAVYGAGSVVEVSDSALSSVNEYEDNGSNSFATIVIAANNAKISVEGGSVSAKAEADKAQQAVVGMNAGRTNMTLYLDTELVQNGTATLLDIDPAAVNITLRAEYADKANAEGYAVIAVNSMITVKAAVARIGNVNYATIQEAVDAAQAGEVITILKDVTLTTSIRIVDGKDVTIEGNGMTITAGAGVDAFYVTGGKLTLAAGLNVHATTDCAIYIRGGDVFTAANLTKEGDMYSVIQGNGNYAGNVTVTGGVVTAPATNTAIYWPQNGKLTISGGVITGYSAVYICSGSLEITGGTLHAVGPAGEYDGANGGNFNVPGEALTIEAIGGNSGYEMISSVVITGGTFISDNANPVGTYANTASNPNAVALQSFLSGGEFNKPVAENLCAEGFIPVPDANGNYVVRAGKFVVRNSTTGVGYETLQAAINAATAGDVLTIIDNLNESVTVQMSLTIDGGNKTHTGTITITGNVNVTVQNVKFVNGAISYSSGTSSGRLTVKDSTFQNGGYAITTASIRSVTIENCNVFNQSLLYAKKSTSEIIVKDVTVVGGNYGAHIVYNNTATFENVIMVDMKYGIMVQNYGAKVITLNNCDIRGNNPIYTWEKASATDTFKFVGANKLVPTDPATFTLSQYMKLVLADETATLEAPANLGVTEGIEHPCYKVVYENGIYKVVLEHTVVVDAAVAPDCTNTGLTEGSHCDVCDEVLVAQQVVDALGHTWEEATVYAPKTCTVCGVTEGDPLKAVASIGANKFTSIKEAVDAANNGDVIVILESGEIDIASGTLNEDGYYALIVAGNGKEFTIDLNGKQLTVDVTNLPAGLKSNMLLGVFCADTNGKLTLTDSFGGGSVSVTGGATNTVYSMAIAYEGLINIEGGSYSVDYMNEGRGMIYGNVSDHSNPDGSNAYAGVNISGGNFHLGNVGTLTNGSPWILATSGSNSGKYVFVSGGTYNSDVLNQHWVFEVFAPTTKALKNNGNGTYTVTDAVVYLVHHEYSEYHSETGFATIEEALERAVAGDTIVLNKDITLDAGLTIPANLELTLDLAGHTLSLSEATTTTSALITNNGTLTITDTSDAKTGKLTYSNSNPSTGYSTSTIINNGVLTVEGGTIENNTTSGAPYAVDNYNTLTVNGGTFVAVRNVIRQAQFGNYDNIVTINGGTFTGYAGLQLHVFNNTKKTETVINGGTFNGTYATYTSFYTANASANTSITVNDGTFNGDYAVFFYNSKAGAADYAFNAAIKGGTFNAPVYVYVNDAEGNSIDLPVISGGTFTDPVLAENCVAGFGLHANADGTYGVHEHIAGEAQKENETLPSYEAVGGYDMVVHCTVCDEILSSTHVTVDKLVAAATVDGVSYETLADALAAASGKTIVLQTDVTYAGYMILDGATLDLNGHTLTVDGALIALKGSNLIDSKNGTGKLVVDTQNSLVLSDTEYPMLPVWMEDHFVFVEVTAQHTGTALGEDSFNIKLRPGIIGTDYTNSIFANGADDNGLTIEIYVHCYKLDANGNRIEEVEELHFILTNDYIKEVYGATTGKLAIGLTIKGATAELADEYAVSYVVKSERGVSFEVKDAYIFTPGANQ